MAQFGRGRSSGQCKARTKDKQESSGSHESSGSQGQYESSGSQEQYDSSGSQEQYDSNGSQEQYGNNCSTEQFENSRPQEKHDGGRPKEQYESRVTHADATTSASEKVSPQPQANSSSNNRGKNFYLMPIDETLSLKIHK